MTKRNYPLFIIDRSRHSSYPYDFISCYDREVGFIAKSLFFNNDQMYREFLDTAASKENFDIITITHRYRNGYVMLIIVDFLYYFEWTNEKKTRIKTLLKKSLKKYLHAENIKAPKGEALSIDNQIKMQEETIARAKANYEELIKRSLGDSKLADYQIALIEATLNTLKSFRDNQKFINLN